MRKLISAIVLPLTAHSMQVNLFTNHDGDIQKVYISPHWKVVETIKRDNNRNVANLKIKTKGDLVEIFSEDKKVRGIVAVSEDGDFIFSESGKLIVPKALKKIILYLVDEKGNLSLPITLKL